MFTCRMHNDKLCNGIHITLSCLVEMDSHKSSHESNSEQENGAPLQGLSEASEMMRQAFHFKKTFHFHP